MPVYSRQLFTTAQASDTAKTMPFQAGGYHHLLGDAEVAQANQHRGTTVIVLLGLIVIVGLGIPALMMSSGPKRKGVGSIHVTRAIPAK